MDQSNREREVYLAELEEGVRVTLIDTGVVWWPMLGMDKQLLLY